MCKATKKRLLGAVVGVLVTAGGTAVMADPKTRTHYRCWDDTLRVSHGGWVSYYQMADANCRTARKRYPNNNMWVQAERY